LISSHLPLIWLPSLVLQLLTTSPVLTQLDIAKSFDVYCDASGIGLDCVLMQEGRVIAHSSRQLCPYEEHYLTHDLELTVVVHVLHTWWHYLLMNMAHIFTDHKSLRYLFTQSDLNMRQRRWLELIKNYDLEIHYHPDRMNVVTDALRCKAHYNYLSVDSISREESSVRVTPIMSYPVFMSKSSTHRMHDPGSIVPHIRPKVLTDNQMS
jgi:hypothetical protein